MGGEADRAVSVVRAAYARLAEWPGGRGAFAGEVHTMRERLLASVDADGGIWDMKRGEGGLVDLEFAWQLAACDSLCRAATENRPVPSADEVLAEWLGAARHRDHVETLAFLRRLETARRELEQVGDYQHVVINDDLETAVSELHRIVEQSFQGSTHAR